MGDLPAGSEYSNIADIGANCGPTTLLVGRLGTPGDGLALWFLRLVFVYS